VEKIWFFSPEKPLKLSHNVAFITAVELLSIFVFHGMLFLGGRLFGSVNC
jgi:hypothetical protein